MADKKLSPDFIFESSWEVCNKVGGIYTVLSTRAKTLQETNKDKVVFIGPDIWLNKENPLFIEDQKLWPSWVKKATQEGLRIRVGRWNIPGQPCVILVDFTQYFAIKNDIYGAAWNDFQVDSLHAYGDYDERGVKVLDKHLFYNGDNEFDAERVYEGAIVPMNTTDGQIVRAQVVEITDDKVTIDLNHPLAGEDLHFVGKVIDVRDVTEGELKAIRHQGGCGHCKGNCEDCESDCGSNCGSTCGAN